MSTPISTSSPGRIRRTFSILMAAVIAVAASIAGALVIASPAAAAQPPVGLGTANSYAVLSGQAITNTGPSVIAGDMGLSPGTSVTGFPPGTVTGTQNITNAPALQAQTDLTTAYNDAAGRTPATVVSADLGGQTLQAGVYSAASTMGLTGTVTLDGANNLNAVFILQAGSSLTTASSSVVRLTRGAQACNVFWQVGSSATLGSNSQFVGTLMALTSASLTTGADVSGRILARNGAVTLDDNNITRPTSCLQPTPGSLPQVPVTPVTPVTPGTPGAGPHLPVRIRPIGITPLLTQPVITNAGRVIKVSVICRLVVKRSGVTTRGDVRPLCVPRRTANGGWRIMTFGHRSMWVTVVLKAPGSGSYKAYRLVKHYFVR